MHPQRIASPAQGGFTLIELIVVIVVLGILAATALPRFSDLGADARQAKMAAARGAVASAVNMVRGQWLVNGDAAARSVTIDGQTVNVHADGYLEGNMIATAAGLDTNDYTIAASTLTTVADPGKASCRFTYTPATGTVGPAPAAVDC